MKKYLKIFNSGFIFLSSFLYFNDVYSEENGSGISVSPISGVTIEGERSVMNINPLSGVTIKDKYKVIRFGGGSFSPVLKYQPQEFIFPTKINVNGNDEKLKDILELGASIEHITKSRFGIGGYISTGEARTESSSKKVDFRRFALFGSYYIPINLYGDFYPYISLGVMVSDYSPNERKNPNAFDDKVTYSPYYDFGVYISKDGKFGGKIGISSGGISVGVSIGRVFVKDSDFDGIFDDKDMCPNTPKGIKTDATGCPLDTDKDGIPDYKDHCSNTSRGEKVDKSGCSIETNIKEEKYSYDNEKTYDNKKEEKIIENISKNPFGKVIEKNNKFVKVELKIYFDFGKWNVKKEYYPVIEKLAKFLKENPHTRIEIQGHTDSIGSEEYNLLLSKRRAESIKEILVKKYGINEDRIKTIGYGESMPVAPNNTEEGRSKNRRVIIIIKKSNSEKKK